MRLLLLDNDPDELKRASSALSEAGFFVEEAPDLLTALALAERQEFAGIVLGHLPARSEIWRVMLDLRLCQQNAPLLAIADCSGPNSTAEFLDKGADDATNRPVIPQELVARVRALIRRARGDSPQILKFADLEIDPLQQRINCGERAIDLSPTEFRILEFLAYRSHAIVSRQLLMARIYPSGKVRESNAIEAHVCNVRRKLRERGSICTIDAIRMRGYRLNPIS